MAEELKENVVDIEQYRVKEGSAVNLKKYSTACDVKIDKAKVKSLYFPQALEQMKELQEKLYAQNTYGLSGEGRHGEARVCHAGPGGCEGGFFQTAHQRGKRP